MTAHEVVHDASVWRARDVRDASAWSVTLTGDERDELVDMAQRALESGRTLATLRRVHTMNDSLATLRGTSIDDVAAILARAAEALAS